MVSGSGSSLKVVDLIDLGAMLQEDGKAGLLVATCSFRG
jgi:hypothetical protein